MPRPPEPALLMAAIVARRAQAGNMSSRDEAHDSMAAATWKTATETTWEQ
jgi:hypothetical protein